MSESPTKLRMGKLAKTRESLCSRICGLWMVRFVTSEKDPNFLKLTTIKMF